MSYANLLKEFKGKIPGPAQVEMPVEEFIEKELCLLGFEVIQRATNLADLTEELAKDGSSLSCEAKQTFREEIREVFDKTCHTLQRRIVPLLRRDDDLTIINPTLTAEERQYFAKKLNDCMGEADKQKSADTFENKFAAAPPKEYYTLNLAVPNEKGGAPKEDWAPFQIVAFPKVTVAMPPAEIACTSSRCQWISDKKWEWLQSHNFTTDNFVSCFSRNTLGMVLCPSDSPDVKRLFAVASLTNPFKWTLAYGDEMALPIDGDRNRVKVLLSNPAPENS